MRARWGRYCVCLQVVSWTFLCFEGVGSTEREVERKGIKGGKDVLAFQSFAFFFGSLLQCDVGGGKGFSFIHQPTIGRERQTETGGRRRRVCFSTRRADLCILLYNHSTSRLCKELCRIPR